MKKQDNIHGDVRFELDLCHENIIIARLIGSWNLDGAHVFVEEFCRHVEEQFAGKEWGVLNDYRKWELCPPDVSDYFDQSLPFFLEKGWKYQAVLTSNKVQEMVIDKYGDVSLESGFVTRYFTDEEEATCWLREQLSHRTE